MSEIFIELGEAGELKCSGCGEINLHHARVETFERLVEDAPLGLHFITDNDGFRIIPDMDGNPSSKRDGVKISFWCEHCEIVTILTIAQHKGTTYIEQFGIENSELRNNA
jgi:hypothetical protein